MTRIPRDMSEVYAPDTALAWAASYGWISDPFDLDAVRERPNDVVFVVGEDQWVRNLTGPAPLAAIVRMDRDLQDLTERLLRFFSGLIDLAEDGASR
jgi:hypothetical protein